MDSIPPVERGPKNANRRTTPPRRPGGQFGNRNAWKHGTRSAQAILRQRVIRAELKALARIAVALELLAKPEVRQRGITALQVSLLKIHRPELAGYLDWALLCRPSRRNSGFCHRGT